MPKTFNLNSNPPAGKTWNIRRPGAVASQTFIPDDDPGGWAGSPLNAAANGVRVTVAGASDPDERFSFTTMVDPGGVPRTMVLRISAVEVASVDYPDDFTGEAFTYTSKDAVSYPGVFTSGNVDL